MRLIDIKRYIEFAYIRFDTKIQTVGNNYYITNVQTLRNAIQYLYKAGFLERNNDEENIYSIIDSCLAERLLVDSSKIDKIKIELISLQSALELMYNWINRYVPDNEDEETINIKLPDIIEIEDLIKASTLINKSLSHSVSEIGGELKVKHLDYGSSWLIISAGTVLGAKLVMAIAKAAFDIAKKYYGVKMMQQQYERYSMGTEMLRTIKEANEKIIASDCRTLAEHLEQEFYSESDNERIERLRVSISEMSKLIELGGEVHPSLITVSHDDIKVPDYNSLISVIKSAGELPRNDTEKSEGEQEITEK